MEVIFADKKLKIFIASLEGSTIAKIVYAVTLLQIFGPKLRMPHSKSIGYSLFELRIRGKIEVRLLYAFRSQAAIVLHVFVKKSQDLHEKDIRTALQKLKEVDST